MGPFDSCQKIYSIMDVTWFVFLVKGELFLYSIVLTSISLFLSWKTVRNWFLNIFSIVTTEKNSHVLCVIEGKLLLFEHNIFSFRIDKLRTLSGFISSTWITNIYSRLYQVKANKHFQRQLTIFRISNFDFSNSSIYEYKYVIRATIYIW